MIVAIEIPNFPQNTSPLMPNIPCLIAGGIISTLAVLGIMCHFVKEHLKSKIPTKNYFNEKPQGSRPLTKSGRHRLNLQRKWEGRDIIWLPPKPYRGTVCGEKRRLSTINEGLEL